MPRIAGAPRRRALSESGSDGADRAARLVAYADRRLGRPLGFARTNAAGAVALELRTRIGRLRGSHCMTIESASRGGTSNGRRTW
jgi:hypothetical protein